MPARVASVVLLASLLSLLPACKIDNLLFNSKKLASYALSTG